MENINIFTAERLLKEIGLYVHWRKLKEEGLVLVIPFEELDEDGMEKLYLGMLALVPLKVQIAWEGLRIFNVNYYWNEDNPHDCECYLFLQGDLVSLKKLYPVSNCDFRFKPSYHRELVLRYEGYGLVLFKVFRKIMKARLFSKLRSEPYGWVFR